MGINHVINEELLSENTQYQRLYTMHADLERQIEEEKAHPLADALRLKKLKRKKLLIADEMFMLGKS